MTEDANPVRALHDAVARSSDPVVASTRPGATTDIEMRRMVQDVLDRLQPEGRRVIELGCGVGVLGVPIARRAAAYVGVDLSPAALEVLKERAPSTILRCADVTRDDLGDLGTYDRVLVYAALHYAASEAEGEHFVRVAVDLLRPGGRAFIGSIPLPREQLPHSPVRRLAGLLWNLRRRLARRPRRPDPASMPAGYCLALTRPMIDAWLERIPGLRWRWIAPRVGVPLHRIRADLLIEKRPQD